MIVLEIYEMLTRFETDKYDVKDIVKPLQFQWFIEMVTMII